VKKLRQLPIAFEAIGPGDLIGRGVPAALATMLFRPADGD
jgi:hypothetical protein